MAAGVEMKFDSHDDEQLDVLSKFFSAPKDVIVKFSIYFLMGKVKKTLAEKEQQDASKITQKQNKKFQILAAFETFKTEMD